jgi:CsoR family transcriptional regulator, copper-sensing transcriptional repressor
MDDKAKLIRRMQIIEGHVRAVQRMIDADEYCIDIIRQINAVQNALANASNVVLERHLNGCVTEAVQGADPVRREQVLMEIADLFKAK